MNTPVTPPTEDEEKETMTGDELAKHLGVPRERLDPPPKPNRKARREHEQALRRAMRKNGRKK